LELGHSFVADFDRLEASLSSCVGDFLAVLVGACQEEGAFSIESVPPGKDVCSDCLVCMPDVGSTIGVVDGSGDVYGLLVISWLEIERRRLASECELMPEASVISQRSFVEAFE